MMSRPVMRLIKTSELNKEQRQEAWRRIRENNHQLAALLSDPQFQSIKDHFDGVVMLSREDLGFDAVNDGEIENV